MGGGCLGQNKKQQGTPDSRFALCAELIEPGKGKPLLKGRRGGYEVRVAGSSRRGKDAGQCGHPWMGECAGQRGAELGLHRGCTE